MKAIVLISGGLDSALAVKILQAQGIEVIGFNLSTPFNKPISKTLEGSLGIRIVVEHSGSEYLTLIRNPVHGFGRNVNPCIDCHIYMLKKAKHSMKKLKADFIATGEVLGQRPMSQNRPMLDLIETKSGLKGLLLRPLSAKLLAETEIEKKLLVDRNRFFDISGRARNIQFELAKAFNLGGFSQPAGGCLLTDPSYADRVKDLLAHKELTLDNVDLLGIGRHFRISKKVKFVVGRSERENELLLNKAKFNDYIFQTISIPGPVALGRGFFDKELVLFCCRAVSCFSDNFGKKVEVEYFQNRFLKRKKIFSASPIEKSAIDKFRL